MRQSNLNGDGGGAGRTGAYVREHIADQNRPFEDVLGTEHGTVGHNPMTAWKR